MVINKDPSGVKKHPDYSQEKTRLDNTIAAMEQSIRSFEESAGRRREKVRQIFKDREKACSLDAFVERTLARGEDKYSLDLKSALDQPYFGRIDYTEDGSSLTETFYFGRVGFDGPDNVKVINWRAPIATIFYECQGGRASYEAPGGVLSGDVSLKRQYEIEKGELINIIDDQIIKALKKELPGTVKYDKFETDQVISDPILVNRLKQTAENRLKDIVETIRAEQNRIIREPLEQVTIIQGAAGSGKTTIALHRIAYLLYNHKHIKPGNVVVIAPNKIFLDYISGVLPSLDAEGNKVQQTTFEELTWAILGNRLELTDDEKLELESNNGLVMTFIKDAVIRAGRIKQSLSFIRAMRVILSKKPRNLPKS